MDKIRSIIGCFTFFSTSAGFGFRFQAPDTRALKADPHLTK